MPLQTPGKQSGFTMLEIVIGVALIGILSSMAVPRFLDFIQRMKGRADASNNVGYLRAARSMAVTNGAPTGVVFDDGSDQVNIFVDSDMNGQYSPGIDSVVLGPFEMAGDATIINSTLVNNSVLFNTDGTANASGQMEFVFYGDNRQTFVVNVLASTGKVKMNIKME